MTIHRTIDQTFDLHTFAHGTGFHGFGLRDTTMQTALDPFLSVDHFYMSTPTFAPHPHAGFSAVTYLFSDSETGFINRDSLGNCLAIAPGALHWTQAGAGVMHEEVPQGIGGVVHGLQIFVNLPASMKHSAPTVFHLDRDDMPAFALDTSELRLVFGSYALTTAKLQPVGNATLVEIVIPAGNELKLAIPAQHNAFILVISGEVRTMHAGAEVMLTPARGASLGAKEADGVLTITGSTAVTRIALFLGTPFKEPVAYGGPFVMNTQDEILAAKRDFAAGRMGLLEASA